MALRLIFMGTPDFSVPLLLELVARGHDIAAVYTRAAKPGGRRGLELVPSPVAREARRLGLNVLPPKSLRAGAARGECDGGGAVGAGARHVAGQAAAGGGCHLRREDRQGRDTDRLEQ